jgi:hypothetical protein
MEIIDLLTEREKKKEKAKLDPFNSDLSILGKEELELFLVDQLKSYIEENTQKGLKAFFIATVDADGNINSARGVSNTLNKLGLFSLLGIIQTDQHSINREILDSLEN